MRNAKCKIIPGQFEFCNSHFAFSNSPASQQTRSTPFALNSPYSGLFISPVPTRLLSRAASCPEPPPVPSLLLSRASSCPKPSPVPSRLLVAKKLRYLSAFLYGCSQKPPLTVVGARVAVTGSSAVPNQSAAQQMEPLRGNSLRGRVSGTLLGARSRS